MFLCLYLLIFLLPEELSGFFWRKEEKEDEDKDAKEGVRTGGWGGAEGEEEKGKHP